MDETRKLADKIARLLESEQSSDDLASIFARLEKINHRMDRLEAAIDSSGIHEPKPLHSSQEKFAVLEAIADEIFGGIQKEKACAFEPNGKPCDHCSMCSSRGF